MGAVNVMERIALAGVRLKPMDSERLAAEPADLITDELRNLIRAKKPALLELLRAENEPPLFAELDTLADIDREAFEERAGILGLARYPPERLPAGDGPENYPAAQIRPGNDFFLERERRRGGRS